jgi:hypothetical protein
VPRLKFDRVAGWLIVVGVAFVAGVIWSHKAIWPFPQLLAFKNTHITPQKAWRVTGTSVLPGPPTMGNPLAQEAVGLAYKHLYNDLEANFWVNSQACPEFDYFLFDLIGGVRQCNRLSYRDHGLSQYSVLLKHPGPSSERRGLLVYNHGHNGPPIKSERFAQDFLRGVFKAGYDVLLVSMPLVGFNEPTGKVQLKTLDGLTTTDHAATIGHAVFETLEVNASSYLRFFIDDAVFFISAEAKNYHSVSYAGHSGGAWSGVYVCSALRHIISKCLLSSGVMPLSIRVSDGFRSFGDAEQISGEINSAFPVVEEIVSMSTKMDVLFTYNSRDPCCYNGVMPSKFKDLLEGRGVNVGFVIGNESSHSYDPDIATRFIVK